MRVFKFKIFLKWAKSENLKDSVLIEAALEIEKGLIDGDLGGNIVKKRVAGKGQGKRGGFRTIVGFKKGSRVLFIYGYPKSKRENITSKEEKALKELARPFLAASEAKLNEMIANGDLYEVMS